MHPTKAASDLTAVELHALIHNPTWDSIPALPPGPSPRKAISLDGVTFGAVLAFWFYSIPALLVIGLAFSFLGAFFGAALLANAGK